MKAKILLDVKELARQEIWDYLKTKMRTDYNGKEYTRDIRLDKEDIKEMIKRFKLK